ncbi:hypothetical protein CGRA01v4_00215 [Colletotrichum graminicola]|nr:hypothetical protein CGRA01v4_00215 [Colletotrichum graminicola]
MSSSFLPQTPLFFSFLFYFFLSILLGVRCYNGNYVNYGFPLGALAAFFVSFVMLLSTRQDTCLHIAMSRAVAVEQINRNKTEECSQTAFSLSLGARISLFLPQSNLWRGSFLFFIFFIPRSLQNRLDHPTRSMLCSDNAGEAKLSYPIKKKRKKPNDGEEASGKLGAPVYHLAVFVLPTLYCTTRGVHIIHTT